MTLADLLNILDRIPAAQRKDILVRSHECYDEREIGAGQDIFDIHVCYNSEGVPYEVELHTSK